MQLVPLDQTVGEYWAILDDQGKREWLLSAGWRVSAESGDPPLVIIESQGLFDDLARLGVPDPLEPYKALM